MRNTYLTFILIAIFVIVGSIYLTRYSNQASNPTNPPQPKQNTTPSPQVSITSASVIGQRTKTSGCGIQNALPDRTCTPGAVIEGVTKDQVCTPGYAKSVRNVSQAQKAQVYEEYGLPTTGHQPGEYEVDHLISLELGGSNEIANLWPEAAKPRPGFHEKDHVENYLNQQVCNGTISLQQAQQQISTNWLQVYKQLTQ